MLRGCLVPKGSGQCSGMILIFIAILVFIRRGGVWAERLARDEKDESELKQISKQVACPSGLADGASVLLSVRCSPQREAWGAWAASRCTSLRPSPVEWLLSAFEARHRGDES